MPRKKKIAIVGAGNAGCLTALSYYFYGNEIFDIQIYYDPNAPIERVGQGTQPSIAALISDSLDVTYFDNKINYTLKTGILYEGWGKKKEKIFHDFPIDVTAIHYVPNLLSKQVLNSGYFEVIESNVQDLEMEIDCDYIFDCRGKIFNDFDSGNYETLINPLNSVILSRKEEVDFRNVYTRCVATPDGWTFVIPNIDSTSYGYLYNSNITKTEDAKNNFIKMFDVVPDGQLSFKNYISKNAFIGERTILNGNRLCFIEPMEALSSSFYLDTARYAWDHIVEGVSKDEVNNKIKKTAKQMQNFILWHYQNGSKYDTDFWKYAKSLKFEMDEDFVQMINYIKNDNSLFLKSKSSEKQYSLTGNYSFKLWYDNVCKE